jgi:outer membrane autotransporter protein
MVVNGNVAMNTGSTALFELGSPVSDKLVVNGVMSIAQGSTLQLVGTRPLTPGVTYDLITASGGIQGQFSTIVQDTTVGGIIRQSSAGVELLGLYQLSGPVTGAAATGVAYMNDILVAGTASSSLLAAMPSLLDANGYANPAAFRRITPESYASAQQMGIEAGLVISDTLRSIAFDRAAVGQGWFGFGQAFGAWRRLPGEGGAGSASANVNAQGLLGGIGYGTENFSIAGFVGRIDSRQRVRALDAVNDADGVIAGAMASFRGDRVDVSLSFAYDGSDGTTTRHLPNGDAITGDYALHGWSADVALGYRIPVGDNWSLRPEIGYTHVQSRRGDVVEGGVSPFALDVDGRTAKADFASAALSFGTNATLPFRGSVSLGVRHQFNGERVFATGGFVGNAAQMTVIGVERDATLATVGASLAYDVTPALTLGLNGRTEFGGDNSIGAGSVSLRLRF